MPASVAAAELSRRCVLGHRQRLAAAGQPLLCLSQSIDPLLAYLLPQSSGGAASSGTGSDSLRQSSLEGTSDNSHKSDCCTLNRDENGGHHSEP